MTETGPLVSNRHLQPIIELCETRQIPLDPIFNALNPSLIRNQSGYLPWQQFTDVLTGAARYLDAADLPTLGRMSWRDPALTARSRIGRILFSAKDQYLALYGPAGYIPKELPVTTRISQPVPGELTISMELPESLQACPALYHMLTGQLEQLTAELGLDAATVTLAFAPGSDDRRAEFRIHYPEVSPGLLATRNLQQKLRGPVDVTLDYALLLEEFESLQRTAHLLAERTEDPGLPATPSGSSTSASFIRIDDSNRISHVTSEAAQLFGFSAEELINTDVRRILPESLGDDHLRSFYQATYPASVPLPPVSTSIRGLTRDKSLVSLEVRLSVTNTDGSPGKVLTLRDRSALADSEQARQRLHEELQALHRVNTLGELTGGITHDFNNLLVAILGYVDLAIESSDTDKLPLYLAEIRRAGERGADMTRKLLSFSRSESTDPVLMDAGLIIENNRDMIRRMLPVSIDVTFENHASQQLVMADPTRLDQVLLNLVINARDAMPTGGQLHISLEASDTGHIVLTVADTGMGMSDEVREQIFEPYFTTKPDGHGTGLGLAVIHDIVQALDGTIDVRSSPGEGTSFQVRLPIQTSQPPRRVQSTPSTAAINAAVNGSETILVVDDDENVRRLARLILITAGYEVLEAADGQKAIEIFAEHAQEIDLVIINVVLPVTGGWESARLIRQVRHDIPIIFTSEYADDLEQQALIGGSLVIEKPYGTDTLRQQVRQALDNAPVDVAGTRG